MGRNMKLKLNLSHRERLLWLQERRKPGLWVQCDECNRWRYLATVLDKSELPARWRCAMNKGQGTYETEQLLPRDMGRNMKNGPLHRERLLWLQERRKPGLWVQCDECNRWRYLATVLDKSELPARWRCAMNKGRSFSTYREYSTVIRIGHI
ncbi:CW-type zinc finger domain-containing protein [Phthorimaea operculella]|nr:CW-type zinc finger domain-containing protein [Phthorimaea operculella]KAI5634087.1 CW-type zinc finger domain-containing protein [Phthorimaea operculella]